MITASRKIITVAIADDHILVRRALAQLITAHTDYKVCIQAGNGKELLEQLDSIGLPDMILLDISMPVMDGFRTMALLKKKYQNPVVVALTGYNDNSAVRRMRALGIKGYLFKTQDSEEMFFTLDAVASNGEYFPEEITEDLHCQEEKMLYQKISALKEKELIFLKYLCQGMKYKEIAAKMFISPYTVEDYRDALFKKFKLKSKTELILFALKHKLVKQEN
jgi:DNA-binding NarL/FixJ family response regulator